MKTRLFLSVGILSLVAGPVHAAGDVDLLSFDPIPQKRQSDAPPVEVISPQIKTMPSAPVAEPAPPARVVATPVSPPVEVVVAPEPIPAPDHPAVAKPARPQPPVEVAPKKTTRPVAKAAPPAAPKKPVKAPVTAKPETAKAPEVKAPAVKEQKVAETPVVKDAPVAQKPVAEEPKVTPPPKAAVMPVIRPVMKVTEPAAVTESFKLDTAKNEKSVAPDKLKMVGPKEVIVPPPSLNPDGPDDGIEPLPVDHLDQAIAPEKLAALAEPPPAPESFVKMKEAVIQNGDPLRIEVAGEGDLSGWYKVMDDGSITLPILGRIRAQGFTPAKLAEILTATLKDGYLVDPKVTVTGKAAH